MKISITFFIQLWLHHQAISRPSKNATTHGTGNRVGYAQSTEPKISCICACILAHSLIIHSTTFVNVMTMIIITTRINQPYKHKRYTKWEIYSIQKWNLDFLIVYPKILSYFILGAQIFILLWVLWIIPLIYICTRIYHSSVI